MELFGKITQILPKQSGETAQGSWKKQDIIVQSFDRYPKKICVSNWKDKVKMEYYNEGDIVKVNVELESREHNGRWYSDIKVWKMEKLDIKQTNTTEKPDSLNEENPLDDGGLPF